MSMPKPMSAARLEELRRVSQQGDDIRLDALAESIAEIDRLKAEAAAKDAEIAPANFLAALRKMVHTSEKLKLTATMHWLDIAAGTAHYEIAGRDAETKRKGKRGAK